MANKNWQTSDQAHHEEKTQINKVRNQRGEITTQTAEIHRNWNRITMNNSNEREDYEPRRKGQLFRNIQPTKKQDEIR